jgi:long-subunit acyl-CoA synthetase (AMP-forming)
VYEGYGLTETTAGICVNRAGALRIGTVGRPITGASARIADDGELILRSGVVFRGYWGNPAATDEVLDADGWFHTGDIVRVDEDGYVYFLGRAGAMIKTAGANVTPGEVEKAIAAMGFTSHVLGLPDAGRGETVAAVIVTDGEIDTDALRAALRDTLSSYKIPRVFTTCRPGDVPMLSSGKIDIGGLRKLFDA